jgi:hypothetical protein
VSRALFGACFALLIVLGITPAARQRDPYLTKGHVLTSMLPMAVILQNREGQLAAAGTPIFRVNVADSTAGPVPNGMSDWRLLGFPSLTQLSFHRTGRRNGMIELEYRPVGPSGFVLKFSVQGGSDVEAAQKLRTFFAVGPRDGAAAKASADAAFTLLAPRVFTNELAALPLNSRVPLMRHIAAIDARMAGAVYREQVYVSAALASDGMLYNTLQLNQQQRVARVLNSRLLAALKGLRSRSATSHSCTA